MSPLQRRLKLVHRQQSEVQDLPKTYLYSQGTMYRQPNTVSLSLSYFTFSVKNIGLEDLLNYSENIRMLT